MSKWIASPLRQRLSGFAFHRAKHIVSTQLDVYIWFHADSEFKATIFFLAKHPCVERASYFYLNLNLSSIFPDRKKKHAVCLKSKLKEGIFSWRCL